MRNIIIAECISTGINFIEDIINRGYNPIVLHLKAPDTEEGKAFDDFIYSEYERIDYDFDMIFESDTYGQTLDEVRKHDPLLILPGSERGVVIANRLSEDLGLPCNSNENLDAMTLKNEMHNRLAQKGLRSIRGKLIHSVDEALEFYDSEGLKEVVIKPISSSCSTSVRICLDRDEMAEAVEMLFGAINHYGEHLDELLIQERIDGTEYIVNTVTHKGVHRVTLVWRYNKIRDSDDSIICDSAETIDELSLGEAEMVEYAYAVADAMGIEYGPVHGEYMIDDDGPVLIEVNCRPCGANMPAEYLDRISGQHETDSILDAYLKPERFFEEQKKKYELYAHGVIKIFIVPEDIMARSSPMVDVETRLRSYYSSTLTNMNFDETFFRKTDDLHSSAGYTFLVHEDKSIVMDDFDFLRTVERNAFSLVLSDDSYDAEIKDDESYLSDIRPLLEKAEKYGTGLFVTDQLADDIEIFQTGIDEVDSIRGSFELIIINLNRSLVKRSETDKVDVILKIFSKIKTGGIILNI